MRLLRKLVLEPVGTLAPLTPGGASAQVLLAIVIVIVVLTMPVGAAVMIVVLMLSAQAGDEAAQTA